MMKVLEWFCYQIARRIVGKTAWRVEEEGWEWSLAKEVLEATGLWSMQEYVGSRQATIEYYIEMHLIYELFTWEE